MLRGTAAGHGPGGSGGGSAAYLLGPGRRGANFPKGTGVPLSAGSLVIMQVHYNLFVGNNPVENSLILRTVPATTPLLPIRLNLMLAPPNGPCPTGVTGPRATGRPSSPAWGSASARRRSYGVSSR